MWSMPITEVLCSNNNSRSLPFSSTITGCGRPLYDYVASLSYCTLSHIENKGVVLSRVYHGHAVIVYFCSETVFRNRSNDENEIFH